MRYPAVLPKYRDIVCFAGMILCVCSALFGRTPSDNSLFAAVSVSRQLRTGTIEFRGNRTESLAPKPMVSFGVSAGKQYRLSEQFRLALPVTFEYGFAQEEKIEHLALDDGSDPSANLNTILIVTGIEPQLQAPFRLSQSTWSNVFIGGGVHYCISKEEEWTQDSRHLFVDGDPYLESGNHLAWSVVTGVGIEKALPRGRGYFLRYMFRFWHPISRTTYRHNLFPLEGMPYGERFFSHYLSVGYMVPRLF